MQCILCVRGYCGRCGDGKLSKSEFMDGPVVGLRSWRVDDGVIGMQRPSQRAMQELDVADQLRRCGVKGLFNLPLPGEHGFCGHCELQEGGFSYRPEDFMGADSTWLARTPVAVFFLLQLYAMLT